MFTIHSMAQDMPAPQYVDPGEMCFPKITTETVRKQKLVERVAYYARAINSMIVLDDLATAARELGLWHDVRQFVSDADRRICNQYKWAVVRRGSEALLVQDGRDLEGGRHFRLLEHEGYCYCGEASTRFVK